MYYVCIVEPNKTKQMSKRGYLIRKAKRDKLIAQHINETHIQAFLERKLKESIEQIGGGLSRYSIDITKHSFIEGLDICIDLPNISTTIHPQQTIDEHIEIARKLNELNKLERA